MADRVEAAAINRVWRRTARVVAIGCATSLALPVLGLIPAAIVDIGPGGNVRQSLFPLAITVWDPFVWVCARNSAIVAAIVTAISLGLGTAIARTVGPRRFWGRAPLAALAWVPMAVGPAFAAVGIAQVVPSAEIGRRLAAMTGHALLFGVGWDAWMAWGLLIWVGVASSTPVVALAVKAAIGRVEPGWVDMGRALGASRQRAWRQLAWPIVRPEVARTIAAVFATALLEPGAPLVLGLRRTLAFQIVETVLRGDPSTRAAVLAMIGLGLAAIGRLLIRWWGGPRLAIDPRSRTDRPIRSGPIAATIATIGLIAWAGFALLPLAGLVGIVAGAFEAGDRGWVVAVATAIYAMIDRDNGRLWINALALGLASTAVAASIVAVTSRGDGRRPPRPVLAILGLDRTPPLILGVAVGLVAGLLTVAGAWLRLAPLNRGADWLDPARATGVLLILATAASRLPTLARAADRAALEARPSLAEAARGLGASRRRASRLAGGRAPGWGLIALTFALAATSVAPAIVLSPTIATRTVGPGVVALADDPPRAAGLALVAVALNLIGFLAARRGQVGPAGDWFRG